MRFANARQGIEGWKSQEEVAGFSHRHERFDSFSRACSLPQCFNGVIPHVRVRVFQRLEQCWHCAQVSPLSQSQRRLNA